MSVLLIEITFFYVLVPKHNHYFIKILLLEQRNNNSVHRTGWVESQMNGIVFSTSNAHWQNKRRVSLEESTAFQEDARNFFFALRTFTGTTSPGKW